MGRHAQLMANIKVGEDLIAREHFGAPQIQSRIDKVKDDWSRLEELCKQRKDRLNEAQDMYQVNSPTPPSCLSLIPECFLHRCYFSNPN